MLTNDIEWFFSEENEAEAALSSMVTSLECEVLIIIMIITMMIIMINDHMIKKECADDQWDG